MTLQARLTAAEQDLAGRAYMQAELEQKLADTQNEDGSWDASLGAPLSTAFGLLSIALTYRYLPIYER